MTHTVLRDPTEAELKSPIFNAVWKAIKKWDISRDSNGMYAVATGTDVCTVLDAITPVVSAELHMLEVQRDQARDSAKGIILDLISELSAEELKCWLCGPHQFKLAVLARLEKW